MKTRLIPATVLTVVLLAGSLACAQPSLSLSLSKDPATLIVGDNVTVSVNLAGLALGQEIDFAGATVNFSSTVFGSPVTITGGPIILNPSDLLLASGPGFADASYDTTSNLLDPQPITGNGTFFNFNLMVLAGGQGQIAFDFADLLDDGAPVSFTLGAPVEYTATVPEPSSLILLAGLPLLLRRRR